MESRRTPRSEDVNVLAGQIVDPAEYRGHLAKMWARVLEAIPDAVADMTTPYPGSIASRCDRCGIRLTLGPGQVQMRERHPDIEFGVACPLCAARASARDVYGVAEYHQIMPDE